MKTSRMTVKGQVTVPKEFRIALGLGPGDEVGFVGDGEGLRVVKVDRPRTGRDVLERLRRVEWDPAWTTGRLMALTRGEDVE